jgi:hypothetical protein
MAKAKVKCTHYEQSCNRHRLHCLHIGVHDWRSPKKDSPCGRWDSCKYVPCKVRCIRVKPKEGKDGKG